MGLSIVKIIAIIFIAAIIALLVNYLQPDGLKLFNENKYQTDRIDQQINPPPGKPGYSEYAQKDTVRKDYNKIAMEKNRMDINEDLLPSYNYKTDSDLGGEPKSLPDDKSDDNGNIILSTLTTDIFNQPRLISLAQAHELYRDKVLFIDARNPEEYKEGHISGAINIPYFSVDEFIDKLSGIDKSKPLVTYCEGADCDMSIRLGNELFKRGYKKVFVFFGGWEQWRNADYPMISSNENFLLN